MKTNLWVDRLASTSPGIVSALWFDDSPARNFYRIRSFRPLMP